MNGRAIPLRRKILRLILPLIAVLGTVFSAMVYNDLYASILQRFELRLVTISALVGSLVDPSDHDELVASLRDPAFKGEAVEQTSAYEREIAPMRAVRRKLGLTYLYTQILGQEYSVRYILDATEGEEHTTVGYEDELPPETVEGLRRLDGKGQIYVSPIQEQEAWGLLKTAAAPVWNAHGAISASVGADVNISVIRKSTEDALLISGLIGGLSLLVAAGTVSVAVSRVARPLAAIRKRALAIAAEIPAADSTPSSLAELLEIDTLLTQVADRIAADEGDREQAEAIFREQRIQADAMLTLRAPADRGVCLDLDSWVLAAFAPSEASDLEVTAWRRRLQLIEAIPSTHRLKAVEHLAPILGEGLMLVDRSAAIATALRGSWLIGSGGAAWLTVSEGEARGFDATRPLTARSLSGDMLTIEPAGENASAAA